MSETVASALQFVNEENTRETRKFIRMIDQFFDALNVKNPLEGKLEETIPLPYCSPRDERFKVILCVGILRIINILAPPIKMNLYHSLSG